MNLNDFGKLIDAEWLLSEKIRNEIILHEYIIMPNHFHGIVEIIALDGVGANGRSPVHDQGSRSPVHDQESRSPVHDQESRSPVHDQESRSPVHDQGSRSPVHDQESRKCVMRAKSIGSLIAGFKSSVVSKINKIQKTPGSPVLQRNYWEHIIRNANEYSRISNYIVNNAVKWENDKLNNGQGNVVMESSELYNFEEWMV